MTKVYVASDNIVSPIGITSSINFKQLTKNVSGISNHTIPAFSDSSFYASLFNNESFINNEQFTKFEQLLIASISDALENCSIELTGKNTLLILSSTKGNISLLESEPPPVQLNSRVSLHSSAKRIAAYFKLANTPLIVSNACISGSLALIIGMRLIKAGKYENILVAGADVISKFILSGFQSFQAISHLPCKPFDKDRNGINLGEAAGTIILTSDEKRSTGIKIMGGTTSNDANHISGPSRTGAELSQAINKTLLDTNLTSKDIDFISAHGTATLYNDEMEAKAITLSNLQKVPTNSLKGFFGHTLGAAGIIESIASFHSLKNNLILPTMGFSQSGGTNPINICSTLQPQNINHFLKIASGFGGCNAAVIYSKQ
jgi:3-oxoacyl-[acyl-carrier-protein] synthase-1